MALVRSAYLAFLVGYTLAVSPISVLWSGTPTRPGAPVPLVTVERLFLVAWLAIGWIGVETVISWGRVWLDARARRRAATPLTGPPPAP
jgi:hypothetical protein